MQWVVRIRDNPVWAQIAYTYLSPGTAEGIWECNLNPNDVEIVFPISSFWRQVMHAWATYNYKFPNTSEAILKQIVWCNLNIRVDNKPITNLKAWRAGLRYMSQLVNEHGFLHTYGELNRIFPDLLTWFEHAQIITAIPHEWKQLLLLQTEDTDMYVTPYQKIMNETKISQMVYKQFIDRSADMMAVKTKWQVRLAKNLSDKEFEDLFVNIYIS